MKRPLVFVVGDCDADIVETHVKNVCEAYGGDFEPRTVRWDDILTKGETTQAGAAKMARNYILHALAYSRAPVFVYLPKLTKGFVQGVLDTYSDAQGPVEYAVLYRDSSVISGFDDATTFRVKSAKQ